MLNVLAIVVVISSAILLFGLAAALLYRLFYSLFIFPFIDPASKAAWAKDCPTLHKAFKKLKAATSQAIKQLKKQTA